jgi:hypothetical protein
MGACEVYRTREAIYVCTAHIDTYGLGFTWDPLFRLPRNADATTLGAAVFEALAASRRDVDRPPASLVTRRLLEFTGRKSWRKLARESVSLEVWEQDGDVVVTPSIRDENDALLRMEDDSVRCGPGHELVGRTISEVLDGLEADAVK